MMYQLNPTIPVETPKGKATAIGWLDYGPEHHLLWICFVDATGECWSYPNHQIRAQSNPSMRYTPKVDKECLIGEPWHINTEKS